MIRGDLLALGEDDLVVLANRGLVRRAARDVADRSDLRLTVEPDGALTVTAEDATTTIGAGARPEDAVCSCVAGGVCRHVVRAILVAQAAHREESAAGEQGVARDVTATDDPAVGRHAATAAWDPGELTDDALAAAVGARTVARARALLAVATPVGLVRAGTPVARLHGVGVTVRFLVPGDASWARCTCAADQPCAHAVLAVHAFRALPPDRAGGTVEVGVRPAVDLAARQEAEDAVLLLAEAGAASATPALRDVLERAAATVAGCGWGWIADALLELAEACRRHTAADPSFVPTQVAELVGEVLARLDALDADVPRGLVAGSAAAGEVAVRGGVLVGLGTVARRVGRTTAVDALMLDDGGHVARAGRTLVDPDEGAPPTFAHVASGALHAGVSCADAGRGQLVVTGARIRADGRLVLGRRRAALSAQRYDWETRLPAGVLAAGFAQAATLDGPDLPRVLSARTVGAGFAVVPVADADGGWDPVEHAVLLRLRDHDGGAATLVHPYAAQGPGGVEALLGALSGGGRIRAVAGWVVPGSGGPRVRASGVVVEAADGHRSLVQPWTDPAPAGRPGPDGPPTAPGTREAGVVADLRDALGDLLTAGVGRPDRRLRDRWRALTDAAESAGSVLLAGPLRRLAAAIERSALEAAWSPRDAVTAAGDLAVLLAASADLRDGPTPTPEIADI